MIDCCRDYEKIGDRRWVKEGVTTFEIWIRDEGKKMFGYVFEFGQRFWW